MDETLGTSGSLRLPDNGLRSPPADGRILADGSFVFLSGLDLTSIAIHRYRADRTPDLSFAGSGRSVVPLRDTEAGTFFYRDPRIVPVPDGGFIARARGFDGSALSENLYKVDARGAIDRMFGDDGYLRHRATTFFRVVSWAMQPDGHLLYTAAAFQAVPTQTPVAFGQPPSPNSYVPASSKVTRIQAVSDIVEFHNRITNHYFIAQDGPEAKGIDDGAAGEGWVRTGERFRPGGPAPACRFYGAGPNTHFFTTDPAECETVERSPGWIYEGLGFYATRAANGRCPDGLHPVHRLYNNRAAQRDSNHRFVTNLSLAPDMQRAGWILEGVAFCVVP
jgi:hypothetical protein